MSQFFSGTLDPAWPHAILIAGTIIGGALVGLGVILEAPKILSIAVAAVFLGVVIEAACTLLLFAFDEGITSKQKSDIEAQQSVIRSQNDKINAQQSQIIALKCEGIALEKIIAPRVLAPSRLAGRIYARPILETKFLTQLRTFGAEVKVRVQSAHDPDAETIAADLKYLLEGAGWAPKKTDETKSHLSATEIRAGISVYAFQWYREGSNPDAEPAKILREALEGAGLDTHGPLNMPPPELYGFLDGPNFGPEPSDNIGFVYVAIGPRPMEFQLAELKRHSPTSCD